MRFNCGWYLIYTKPNHEWQVARQLGDMNFSFFMPTQKSTRIWHDRRKIIEAPLFPGYIFIYLQKVQDYLDALSCKGALKYIKFGNEVAVVPDKVVENLKLVINNCKNASVTYERLKPGRRIIITSGILTGLDGEIVKVKNQNKLIVRVNLLNRIVLADIDYEPVS